MVALVSVAAILVAAGTVAVAWWKRAPVVMGLAVANSLVFAVSLATGARARFSLAGSPLLDDLAARVIDLVEFDWPRFYTIFTATFLHANVAHLIGNMIVLLLIGVPFEHRVGRGRFLAIYFLSAIVAVLLHGLWILSTGTDADLRVPLVGASGAVFGILGAFAAMYPVDKVPMIVPFFLMMVIRLPVFLAAVLLMAIEGVALFGAPTGVAHAAHLGGAVGGVIFGLALKPRAPLDAERPRRLDYEVLERLASTPQHRTLVEKLRENEDHPETQRAWLDRLLGSLACPRCGQPYGRRGRDRIECSNGHEERYAS